MYPEKKILVEIRIKAATRPDKMFLISKGDFRDFLPHVVFGTGCWSPEWEARLGQVLLAFHSRDSVEDHER